MNKNLVRQPEGSAMSLVVQIFTLLYRRFSIGRVSTAPAALELASDPQVTNLRHSRLQVCATVLWGATAALLAASANGESLVTRAQLEADWLRQEEVRAIPAHAASAQVTVTDDAAGGCDGVKTGKWGFHTLHEPNPWWRVDLGQVTALDRLRIFNRCDECAPRNSRLIVALSNDDMHWQQAYQHTGTVFYGFTDNKPLEVKLNNAQARYLRLQLPGTSYFHLDEVEVYGPGAGTNIALGKPATQSSVSQWSAAHRTTAPNPRGGSTSAVVERGLCLAEALRRQGIEAGAETAALRRVGEEFDRLPAGADEAARLKLFFEAGELVRALALRNPLLDFDSILFVKSAPGMFPHMSDQFYGWWSRPGGGVFVLRDFKSAQPKLRCLTEGFAPGNFLRPDLSYDGKRVLFAYCKHYPQVANLKDKVTKPNLPEDAFYHLFEMNVDGSRVRQLTHGRYDDFNARYLPGGDIVFLSTRKGQFLQCSQAATTGTRDADLPDSYVRCGGDEYRPVPVFTLHAMDARGGNLRPVSAFENFEYTPEVATDGRVLYTRWDYIDRFNGPFFSLWSTNPDGSNPQLVYGNYTVRPQVVCEARSIPNSSRLVFTAAAHHSIIGGSLVLLDRSRGTEGEAPLVRLTPEVPFPETEANVGSYYVNPWPLSEEQFLVAWSDRKLPPHRRVEDLQQNPVNATGLYLCDAFGNLTLLYRDQELSSACPIPLRPRPEPPVYSGRPAWADAGQGSFLLQDVYQGLEGLPRGAIKRLRVIAVPPKLQPRMNSPSLGVSREDPGKFVLGTVPVEADGSAFFSVPSGISVFFQALDGDGLAVQTMRSLTYVGPNETLACAGCHEHRDAAPNAARALPLASRREPSRLTPGPDGSWPLEFSQFVQPVLNRLCVSCHAPNSGDTEAAKLDLTVAKAYENLLGFADKDLHKLAFERDQSLPGQCAASQSKLLALLRNGEGHRGVRLDAESLERLATWMDVYAQRQGHFSDAQADELRELRRKLASILVQ